MHLDSLISLFPFHFFSFTWFAWVRLGSLGSSSSSRLVPSISSMLSPSKPQPSYLGSTPTGSPQPPPLPQISPYQSPPPPPPPSGLGPAALPSTLPPFPTSLPSFSTTHGSVIVPADAKQKPSQPRSSTQKKKDSVYGPHDISSLALRQTLIGFVLLFLFFVCSPQSFTQQIASKPKLHAPLLAPAPLAKKPLPPNPLPGPAPSGLGIAAISYPPPPKKHSTTPQPASTQAAHLYLQPIHSAPPQRLPEIPQQSRESLSSVKKKKRTRLICFFFLQMVTARTILVALIMVFSLPQPWPH